jgi:hypothetical protein
MAYEDDEAKISRLIGEILTWKRRCQESWMSKSKMRAFARQTIDERDAERAMVDALTRTIVALMASRDSPKRWRAAVAAAQGLVGDVDVMRAEMDDLRVAARRRRDIQEGAAIVAAEDVYKELDGE